MKKKLGHLIAAAALALLGTTAQADIVRQVDMTFASGATYSGTVTFKDDYSALLDAAGVLSGGSWGTQSINWTWWMGTGQTLSQDYNGDGYRDDWLMNGSNQSDYSIYLGVSWSLPTATSDLAFQITDAYYSGINQQDILTSARVAALNDVPEPGQLALVGVALAAAAFARRRRQA